MNGQDIEPLRSRGYDDAYYEPSSPDKNQSSYYREDVMRRSGYIKEQSSDDDEDGLQRFGKPYPQPDAKMDAENIRIMLTILERIYGIPMHIAEPYVVEHFK